MLAKIEEIIEEAKNGKMFILVDDENRENEGDLIIPAQMCDDQQVNFMAKYGREVDLWWISGVEHVIAYN